MIHRILVRQALLCILPSILVAQEQPTSQQGLPSWVETAIRYGTKEKKVPPIDLVGKFGNMRYYGNVTTPFLRVALAAHEAKDKYMKFDPSQVTPEMVASVIVLTVPPNFGLKMKDRHRDAKHAIIRPRKSKGSDGVIQPLHVSTFTDTAQNLGGAMIVKQGIKATFPLEAFREDNKIVLIFEDKEYGFDIGKIMFQKGHVSTAEQPQSAAPAGAPSGDNAAQVTEPALVQPNPAEFTERAQTLDERVEREPFGSVLRPKGLTALALQEKLQVLL